MSDIEVPRLKAILERRSGLDLGRGGMEDNLVSYVKRRLEANAYSFERYMEQVDISGSDELRMLIETMTVIYTWFFRDPGQLRVIEQLIADFTEDRAMGIWVAGCATGEEAYSVALIAAALGKRVDILGTDLNSRALQIAKDGVYAISSLSAVDVAMRERYLPDVPAAGFVVPEHVRRCVRFQVGNLVEGAPRSVSNDGWDLVICRNVLIYFSQEQARRTLDMLAGSLAPGGALVLGASEAILERPTLLVPIGVGGRSVLVRARPNGGVTSSSQGHRVEDRSRAIHWQDRDSASGVVRRTDKVQDLSLRGSRNIPPKGAKAIAAQSSPSFDDCSDAGRRLQSTIAQGHQALELGNLPVARDHYLAAARLDPTCGEALMFAGVAYYLDGEVNEALARLRGALCLEPSLWVACFYQALCLESMGYAEDAVRSYAQVLRLADAQEKDVVEHHFLKGWRHDLLAVAKQRANQSERMIVRDRPVPGSRGSLR